jgi:hypothetical protein
MKPICLISVYLGPFPWYFQYFLRTCKSNPSVNFLIFSNENECDLEFPENVKLIKISLDQFNDLASRKLGFSVKVLNPYKICDFKPTFGLLFSDYLIGADFWGHIDLDLIFGDIRAFITEKILADNELVCVRHDFLTGYFLLFRNSRKINYLFTESKDYQRVFLSNKHFCFDETNFDFQSFSENLPLEEMNPEVESMMHVVRKLQNQKKIKAYFDFMVIEGLPGRLRWSNGKLYYKNQFEVLLYHMILFKKVYSPTKIVAKIPDEFRISPTRIYYSRKKG